MFLFMLKMVLSLFLVGLFLQTPVRTADAFTAAFARRKAAEWPRSALIYMPDGTKVVEDDPTVTTDVDWMATSTSNTIENSLLEYLNRPDFRGPLAVLCAAQKHIDITTIQHVHVKAVSPSAISIEAICASADGMTCVNVLVEMEFPNYCQSESEVIENLGVLHQQASAVLEQRELLEQSGVGEDSKRLAEGKAAEEGMAQESKILDTKRAAEIKQRALLEARLRHEEKVRASIRQTKIDSADQAEALQPTNKAAKEGVTQNSKVLAAKQVEEAKQRALLEARLRHEEKIRASIRQTKIDSTDHAEALQPTNKATKEEVTQNSNKIPATKRAAEAKQRALLEARLRHEEKVRASIRECQSKRNAILEARQQPKSPEVEEALKAKYGAMSLQDRAFCILVDLGMVEITPDP